ncbi:glucose-6-phosphate dehydrogenase assembly protein OpcA [Corynebacterium sp. 153RC1]|uniref:glucose-6-phosphate dehydrogenase assembly protein OpcA n=1 Tax=unclassified Corynebacterium TaxID=2624378 RepID=UPI00211C6F42|nr:glucose-6-phosphate dehydrogenase assembly protein OpcA [Corynebacterium sp. 209RC1]MCQ9354445.1 glucose-6-phosphate dehydrogenase assembly protein OpcA [Corynebacterium sp. 1222RC1]MCQ9356666.1 glucose-6-phosphate dehydrogenase assembly protein OpcA [Corynebacterium sp. 122RC1]MCQ9358840.1 glucose-6-phosphate dehydrogenase assembly protein OpcA [Corynebacterium sp. 142RC1]MCQ9361238.1 glucose-6-phosphate dehydrogenase assembly protein OpcA [Corynebacterium sp. 153RC1]MCQ9364173.1 glucose-6
MIFDLPETNTQQIAKTLVRIRDTGNQNTTSRVLTLIVIAQASDDIDAIITATNDASREHPSRVIVLVVDDTEAETRLDAQVRIGGDAGASEVVLMKLRGEVGKHLVHVVTPLLLPDTPIVAWWPYSAPVNPGQDPLGKIAHRRITDSQYDPPVDALYNRRNHYTPGDSDFAWARLTPLRGILASTLDQPPHEMVQEAKVYGHHDSPSVDLAAGWLTDRLGVTVTRVNADTTEFSYDSAGRAHVPISKVELVRPSGTVVIETVADPEVLRVSLPDRAPALVAVSLRTEADCLAEELRHLDPDIAYARALRGLSRVEYLTH